MNSIMRLLCLLVLLALIVFLILEGIVIAGGHDEVRQDPDAVLILGCKIWGVDPSPALEQRLDRALDYLDALKQRGVEPLVVVSGGQGSDEPISEAASMAAYLVNQGLDEARIVLETQSTSTATNLKNSAALLAELGYSNPHIAIVSNGFHLTRVRMLANRYGIDCSTLSAPMPDWPSRIYSTLREGPALIKSFLLD